MFKLKQYKYIIPESHDDSRNEKRAKLAHYIKIILTLARTSQ